MTDLKVVKPSGDVRSSKRNSKVTTSSRESSRSSRTSNSASSATSTSSTANNNNTSEESIRVNLTSPTDNNNASAKGSIADGETDDVAQQQNDPLNSIIAQTDASGNAQYNAQTDERSSAVHAIHSTSGTSRGSNDSSINNYNDNKGRDDSWSSMFYRLVCCSGNESPRGEGYGYSSTQSMGNGDMGFEPVLPPQTKRSKGKICLVLDLDETLVHSSFKPVDNPDFIIPVEIEGIVHNVYVLKRPGVDEFMRDILPLYEVVIYTASLSKYANPLLDQLDIHNVIDHRLFRESCTLYEGNYVKDLSLLGRKLPRTIIIDNSPMSYLFHPENAIGCASFVDDMADRELYYCLSFLKKIKDSKNVRDWLYTYQAFINKEHAAHEGFKS